MKTLRYIIISSIVGMVFPSFIFAQATTNISQTVVTDHGTFKSDGILGCNRTGAYAMSVGSMSVIGGSYVPVSDAAVTLNTGFLVYKECVLRIVVDDMREAATAGLEKKVTIELGAGGHNGGKLYATNLSSEQGVAGDEEMKRIFTDGSLNGLTPAYRNAIARSVLRDYQTRTRNPQQVYGCPIDLSKGDITGNSIENVTARLQNPSCNPIFQAEQFREYSQGRVAATQQDLLTRLNWGQGFYDKRTVDENGNEITATPGSLVNAIATQAITSGFRQTENANDIGQMVSALFADIGAAAISDDKGLAGLSTSVGGKPSYIDQLVKDSSAKLVGGAVNAALQILSGARSVEASYNQVVVTLANKITDSITGVRGIESKCWDLIVSHVCNATTTPSVITASSTCVSTVSGNTLAIATSTYYSQQVINTQIAPVASSTINNINNSNTALKLIDALVASVANTSSLTSQRLALQQLDTLVQRNALHNQQDVVNIGSQAAAVQNQLLQLVNTDLPKAWGDDPDPKVGWCNVNSAATLGMWDARWKK